MFLLLTDTQLMSFSQLFLESCDALILFQVKAVKFGHILVVDEADKAPTNVTCILKTLVESGEMVLSDGRRIVASKWIQNILIT